MDYRLPLNLENTWESAENTKRILLEYISATLEESEIFDRALFEGDGKAYLEGLAESIKKNITKPKVIIAGRSGVGKITLTNVLLGADVMPTAGATPTTSIAVYIKHIDDKPAFIEEDVWVFADSVDPNVEDKWYFLDESRLYDETYCRM